MENILNEIKIENIKEIILKEGNGRCDKIIFEMPEISLDKIEKSYNGKPGCMCGCLGKYSYLKTDDKVSDDQVSEKSVKFVLNKLKTEAPTKGIDVIKDYIFYLEIENRCYALYLKK